MCVTFVAGRTRRWYIPFLLDVIAVCVLLGVLSGGTFPQCWCMQAQVNGKRKEEKWMRKLLPTQKCRS